MRIGIEAQRIFRIRKHGMDFVAIEMIKALQKIDHHNEYFIFVSDGPDKDCLQETPNFKIVPLKGYYPIWEQLKLPAAIKKYGCEILHCTSNTAPVNAKVPVILTIHDIIYFEANPLTLKGYSLYQRLGNLYRRIVVKQNLKSVTLIITVSEFERTRILEALHLPDYKVVTLYNAMAQHFLAVKDEARLQAVIKKYNLPEQYILFLGNTDPKKNTANTIRAFARYCKEYGDKYSLVVADLDSSLILKLLKAENASRFISKIHFTGYVSNTDMPALLSNARMFLYPSRRESFGIPILEGMACGTAVITSNVSSMPEVAGDAAELVDPANIEEIKEAIRKLIDDEGYRQELIRKGLQRATHFSWGKTAKKVLEIYENYK